MNKKKILALVLVVALLLTAIGGTLAYFTDTEEAKNVFTVGSVDIELLESQYYTNVDTASDADIRNSAENYQAYLAEAGKNVVPGREFNKAIYIDNVGDSPAYVRVRMVVTRDQFNSFWFYENTDALEKGDLVKGIIAHYPGGGHMDYSSAYNATTAKTDFADIKADPYWTELEYVYTYTAPLAAKDLTDDSPVWKFAMKNLDNEDVVNLKANTNILVYADAIQAEGFADYKAAFAAFADQKDLIQGNVDTWDGTAAGDFGPEEDGTYVINSAEDFAAFVAVANGTAKAAAAGNTFEGATVKLNTNVILAGQDWTEIKDFAGTFDGQGYTIFGLNKNLFGTVSGTVKNLNVNDVTIVNTTKNGANGFIKTVAAGGLIDNCTVSGVDIQWTGTIKDMTDGFGGVICQVSAGATVQNCEFTDISVTTYGKTKRTGGVFDGIAGTVKDCVFTNVNFTVVDKDGIDGYVTSYGGGLAAVVNGGAVVEDCVINNMQVNVDDGGHLGGVFGKAHISGQTAPITLKDITVNGLTMKVGNNTDRISCIAGFIAQPDSRNNDVRVAIDNCHIYGLDMTLTGKPGESAAAGFISGLCGGVDVTDCSVSGKIDGTKATVNVGGFVGDAGWYGAIEQKFTNCVADVDITVKDSIGGGFIAVDGVLSKAGVYSGTATLTFTNCQATGTVTVVDGGTGTAAEFCGKTIE